MNVEQIATALNSQILPNLLGEGVVVEEDLSNIVEIGIKIGDANAYDKYVGKVYNVIGFVKVVDRIIKGSAPNISKESWLYGSIMELLSFKLPTAIDNDAYKLVNGNTYNQDEFYAPDLSANFYNDKVSWTYPQSYLANGSSDDRIAQSFSSAKQCVEFWNGIELAITNAITIDTDALIMRTINYYIAKLMYEDIIRNLGIGETYGDKTTVRCINLLKLYNAEFAQTLKSSECLTNKDFLKYASYKMALTMDRMTHASVLFNMDGDVRQTPKESLHFVTLSDFERASEMYLESDTFHKDLIALPKHVNIPAFQGQGTDFEFDSISNIKVKIKSVDGNGDPITPSVDVSGIIGCMFDDYACSVTNYSQNATSHYNAKGDFINTFYSVTAGYNNMYNQNFVVFFVADPTPEEP